MMTSSAFVCLTIASSRLHTAADELTAATVNIRSTPVRSASVHGLGPRADQRVGVKDDAVMGEAHAPAR